MKKYFEILGLKKGASQEEIQEAYERLSDTLDPKKNDDLDFFIEEYELVQEAYKFLKKEVNPKIEKNLNIDDSIESIFETYKSFDSAKKIDFLKEIEGKVISGSQNYKIALNIICKYENCDNLDLLFQKLSLTPKETPKPKKVSKPNKTSLEEKEKQNSQEVIAVTNSDTSSTLIDKYNKAAKESKEGVLTLYKVLGSSGNKECLLALHELLGEPLDLEDNLVVRFVQGIASNSQASNKSFLKEGRGEFGLSKTNPIPVYGIPSNELYLKQLKTNTGGKITWKRKGSIIVKGIEKEIDEYLIYDEKGKKIATFFISPYHWKTSKKLPKGFIHISEEPYNNKNNTEKSNPKTTIKPNPSKHQIGSLSFTKKIVGITAIIALLFFSIYFISEVTKSKYPNLEKGVYAEFNTNKGVFVAKLYHEDTPLTVANFIELAEGRNELVDSAYKGKKYYDGLTFHRIIKDFMIQGGDPLGTGSGNPGYTFPDEFSENLKHDKKGILSMANSGPSTNGSQFFITLKETPWLDGKHSVFGEIAIGQDVVDSLGLVETTKPGDKPVEPVVINELNIIRVGGADVITFNDALVKAEEKAKEGQTAKAIEARATAVMLANDIAKSEEMPSGIKIYFNKKGNGVKPKEGSKIKMNYAGYLTNGTLFDSNIAEVAKKYNTWDHRRADAGGYQPILTDYSKNAQLIPGFREGLLMMSIGDKITLLIPSHLAYGERGIPNLIPPRSDLFFTLEIVAVVN